MDLRPMDKVVIITGGAKGIGAAITRVSIGGYVYLDRALT